MHAGAPRHLVFSKKPTAEQLLTELTSVPLAGVELHKSAGKLPPESLPAVIAAMVGSAATFTALYNFPLVELPRDIPGGGLAAFTRLRALSFRQRMESPMVLRAAQLPPSVEELTFMCHTPFDESSTDRCLSPVLVGFHRLHSLRRITLVDYYEWRLSFEDTEETQHCLGHLPPSLEVCAVASWDGTLLVYSSRERSSSYDGMELHAYTPRRRGYRRSCTTNECQVV